MMCEREDVVFMANINMYQDGKMLICIVCCNEEYKLYVVISNVYQVE